LLNERYDVLVGLERFDVPLLERFSPLLSVSTSQPKLQRHRVEHRVIVTTELKKIK
jgi:hypothetical protein